MRDINKVIMLYLNMEDIIDLIATDSLHLRLVIKSKMFFCKICRKN